jgi:aminoglycoside/choline kinase family phosphotransferase
MTTPRPEIAGYLQASWPKARVSSIAGDASTRRFFRIHTPDGRTRILMDYGQPFRKETDDVRLARIFTDAGLRIAEILDIRGPVGCLLLEDLGDESLEAAIEENRSRARDLLEQAVLLAAAVTDRGTEALARSDRRNGPALDAERFRFEMDFFLEHFAVGFVGRASLPDGLREALHELAKNAADSPRRVLCHRDYHSRNLMRLANGALAMVDIQDARWGPDSYDLASLLRDAYLDVEEEWIDALIERYRSALRSPPADGFRSRLDRVSAQRMLKALGTFGYQTTVRKSSRYLGAITRTVRRLDRLLPGNDDTASLHGLLASAGLLETDRRA